MKVIQGRAYSEGFGKDGELTQFSYPNSQILFQNLNRPCHAILCPDILAKGHCSCAHACIASGRRDSVCQPFYRQPFARDGPGSNAQFVNAVSPEWLIAKERDNHSRNACAQSCSRCAGAPVMDNRRHLRKQPIMRYGFDLEYIAGQISLAQTSPARQQDAALPGTRQRFQYYLRHLLWLAAVHTAKTDVYRRWTRGQAVHQVSGRLPVRLMIQEPVTAEVIPVTPIGRSRNDAGAVSIQNGNASLPHLAEEPPRRKWQHFQLLAQCPIHRRPHELPEGKHRQHMGLPVIIASTEREPGWCRREVRAGKSTRGRYRIWSGHKGWHAQLLSNWVRNAEPDC